MDIQKFEKEWHKLKHQLEKTEQIIITPHLNPDGDAIGSVFGLYWYLQGLGKKTTIVVPNDYPEFLQWLPGNDLVINFSRNKVQAAEIINKADLIFHLDYNDIKRCGDLSEKLETSKAFRVMIDHHPFPQMNADIMISDTSVSSTCELVAELVIQLGGYGSFNQNIAESLLMGIMTDTGCFNHNASQPRTYELVSILLQAGARKDLIFSRVFDSFSIDRMKLMGYCLNEKMVVIPEFQTAYICISLEDQQKFSFQTGDSEGFVNMPLSIKGIQFTALFVEKEDKIKISLRSKGKFAVNGIAEKYFSGGGHTNAAGGESRIKLHETINKFVSLLPLYANELKSC